MLVSPPPKWHVRVSFLSYRFYSTLGEVILPTHVTIRLSPQSYLLGASLKWIISLFILLHALLRVADVLLSYYNKTSWWTRYDITSLGASADERGLARVMDVVVGRPLWREQFT